MKYIYASLLLHAAGRPVNEHNLKAVLTAAGIEPDEVRVKALVAALSEINIDEALKSAQGLALASAPAVAPTVEAKKEEKKPAEEERKEEEALAGLSALFG